jgi:hypothetical protein
VRELWPTDGAVIVKIALVPDGVDVADEPVGTVPPPPPPPQAHRTSDRHVTANIRVANPVFIGDGVRRSPPLFIRNSPYYPCRKDYVRARAIGEKL